MNNRVKEAGEMIYTNAGETDIASGEVVEFTDYIGISQGVIPAGESGVLHTTDIFELPKDATVAIDQGAGVFWDEDAGNVNLDTAETYAGKAVKAELEAATTVLVDINVGQKPPAP